MMDVLCLKPDRKVVRRRHKRQVKARLLNLRGFFQFFVFYGTAERIAHACQK